MAKKEDIGLDIRSKYILLNGIKSPENVPSMYYNEPLKQYSFWKLGLMIDKKKESITEPEIDAIFKSYFR